MMLCPLLALLALPVAAALVALEGVRSVVEGALKIAPGMGGWK